MVGCYLILKEGDSAATERVKSSFCGGILIYYSISGVLFIVNDD